MYCENAKTKKDHVAPAVFAEKGLQEDTSRRNDPVGFFTEGFVGWYFQVERGQPKEAKEVIGNFHLIGAGLMLKDIYTFKAFHNHLKVVGIGTPTLMRGNVYPFIRLDREGQGRTDIVGNIRRVEATEERMRWYGIEICDRRLGIGTGGLCPGG